MSDGLLVKLSILPFEDPETIQAGPPVGPPFVAPFNPESFALTNEVVLGPDEQTQGDDGAEAKFEGIKPRTLSFDFLLDGTGASGPKIEVTAALEQFKATVGFSGDIHRPRFLVLTWGNFVSVCVLESYTITYKLFKPSGLPLRATLSAKFREHKAVSLKELVKNLMSPDVGHGHQVIDGEHLSLIVHRYYKDPSYYLQVAEANGLDTVRSVAVGSSLYLPPVV